MQKTVNLYPSVGLPGQEVAAHTAVYTPLNYLSDGTAAAGKFVFEGTAAAGKFVFEGTPDKKGVAFPVASAKGTTLVGLVERTFTAAVPCGVDGSEAYPNGAELTIAVRGDFYVEAADEATVGQAVLCDPADGAVSYGTVGSGNDTGWVVVTAAKAKGDIIIISRR